MGEVWNAEHVRQRVPVAVKVITARNALDREVIERFRSEVRAVARLNHPGIVVVLDYGEVDRAAEEASNGKLRAGSPYLVMELADGTLGRHAPRSFPELRRLLFALLDALAHAHAYDVIHRDIKPGNVLVFADGETPRFKLADFGLARALDAGAPLDDMMSGTPRYMAPEQIQLRSRDQGPWTDLYAVGCLAWQYACGRPPYLGDDQAVLAAHLLEPIPPLMPLFPVPRDFAAWLEWLLAKEPSARCAHAADARAELETMQEVSGESVLAIDVADEPSALTDLTLVEHAPIEVTGVAHGTPHTRARHSPPRFPEVAPLERPPPTALLGAGLGLYGLRPVPLVGRTKERRELWEAIEALQTTRRPRAILLRGVAGTGKSRIAEWLVRTAAQVGAAVPIRITHDPILGPSHGFAPAIASVLRADGLEPHQVAARVHAFLEARGGSEAALDEDGLTELVRPSRDQARVRFESPAQRHLVIRRFLGLLATDRPVVAWVEDVQWGADTLRAIRDLAQAESLPVLFLMTARDELVSERPVEAGLIGELMKLEAARTIEIAPLPAKDHAELVRQLLGLEGALATDVTNRTMGNPLFAVQLVGEWVQRGALEATPEGFRVAPNEQAIVPHDVHVLWTSRIARLREDIGMDDRAHRSLEVAAVLGLHVEGAEWQHACRIADATIPANMIDAMIARRLATGDASAWSFAHEMLRESIDRSATESGRAASLHRASAAMLKEHYGLSERGVAERLARHFIAAGELVDGAAELLRAALERTDASDFAVAHSLLAEREALLRRLEVHEDDERWALGWSVEALSHSQQGTIAEGEAVATKLAGWASRHERPDLLAAAERSLTALAHRRGALALALAHARSSLEHAREANDDAAAARAFFAIAQLHTRRGEYDLATAEHRAALAMADRGTDRSMQGNVRYGLGALLVLRGERAEGTRLLRDAMTRFQALGARGSVAVCHSDLGEAARHEGDLDLAEEHYRKALRLQEAVGTNDIHVTHVNLALVQLERKNYRAARTALEECLVGLAATGQGAFLGAVHAALLPCLADARDWDAWDTHCAEARKQIEATSIAHDDIGWPAELGAELALASGETRRAREAYAIARAQWVALGKMDRALRIDELLRG